MGLGLGGIFSAASHLGELVSPGDPPPAPSTSLDAVVPLLAGITHVPENAVIVVLVLGIPILMLAGLTSRRSWRALFGVAILTLLAAITWSFKPMDEVDPARVALVVVGLVVAIVAIRVWGARAAWSWFVAALAYQALDGLREAVYAPEWQARGAGALTFLVATVLILLIVRRCVRSPAQISSTLVPS
jgi:hypothetical protein